LVRGSSGVRTALLGRLGLDAQRRASLRATAAGENEAASGDWIGGALIALLFPVIGFIVGLIYVTKSGSKRQVGVMTLGLSCVAFALWLVLANSS
jgi:hypothetical protein